MRVLITGARGNFPTALIRRLDANGHELVLLDIEPMPETATHHVIQADIRDAGAVATAMRGCDAVIHAAAYHGDMAERRNYHDYYSVNVTGTHNVLLGMLRQGVENLVFSSCDTVYGHGLKARRVVDEKVPCIPNSIESLTKMLCEDMCAYYARHHSLRAAILRCGSFSPMDWKSAGIGLLNNRVDREDVAMANELALGAVASEEFKCEVFLIESAKPFVDSDWPELAEDPSRILESYYPGCMELLAANGLRAPKIYHRYDITHAQTVLGYEPEHNFEQFLARLKREAAHKGTGFGSQRSSGSKQ